MDKIILTALVLVCFTVANGMPSNRGRYNGNCETHAQCPDGVCWRPGNGNANGNAQKKCYPDCGAFTLMNGQISDGATTEITLLLSCNAGYFLIGDSEVTCQANGSWSGSSSCVACSCPDGWKRNGDSCYLFDYTMRINFTDAVSFCQTLGGNILQAETEVENDFIISELQSNNVTGWIWLGLTDFDGDGEYTWHVTGDNLTYTAWGNEVYGTDCTSYSASNYEYLWTRETCDYTNVPICEKSICPE